MVSRVRVPVVAQSKPKENMYDNTLVTSVELCDNVKFISDGYEVMLRCADRDIYIDRQKAKKNCGVACARVRATII